MLGIVTTSYAYSIWYQGGKYPTYIHFHANSTFDPASKTAFDLGFDQWNYYSSKPASLWLDRGSDINHNNFPYSNSQNDITKGERGTGPSSVLMGTYVVSSVFNKRGNLAINEVDIDVNTSYKWANSSLSDRYDIQNCFTHEVGHAYGLYHSIVSGATMQPNACLAEVSKRTIELDDKNGIKYIYTTLNPLTY